MGGRRRTTGYRWFLFRRGRRAARGEVVEVQEPLSRGELYRLTAHEQPVAYALEPGGARGFSFRQRVRARLAKAMFGPGTFVPKATAEEYRALHAGWHESERAD